jgi:transposase
MHRHQLTEEDWVRIAPLLPAERGRKARPAVLSNRQFMDAIMYVAKTGVPWRDLPLRFGPWKTIHSKFTRWNAAKVFDRIFELFATRSDPEASIADSTYAKAHQHSAGGKGGTRISVLDALAEAFPQRSTLSWTVSVTRPISTSLPETSTTLPKVKRSSPPPEASTS